MSVTRDDVLRIAALARLGIPEERVPALVAELGAILEHMAVLRGVDTSGVIAAAGVGAGGTPLREDAGAPIPLAHPLESVAPWMRHGFFLVPRIDSHGAGGAPAEES